MERKINIYKSKPLVTVLLLFLLKPAYFSSINILDTIYTWGSYLCTLILLFLVVYSKRITTPIKWIVAFYGTILFSTIYSHGNVLNFMKSNFSSLAMCLLFALWLEKSPETLIDCFSVLEIFVYINLLTIIVFPNGMYKIGTYSQCWLLGYKNPQIRTILPILCMSMIRSYWKSSKLSFQAICLMTASALTFTLINSATSLVGIALFLGLFLLVNKKKAELPKFVTLLNGLYVTIVSFVIIVILQKQYLFSNIIQNWLERDLTFTTRVNIWSKSLPLIKEKLWLGYGHLTYEQYVYLYNSMYASHPHNYFLYLIISGGILLLAVTFIGFLLANKQLKKTSSTATGKIILFALYSFLVMGLTESLTNTVLLYPMLILAMKSQNIVDLGYHNEAFRIHGKKIRLFKRKIKNT